MKHTDLEGDNDFSQVKLSLVELSCCVYFQNLARHTKNEVSQEKVESDI